MLIIARTMFIRTHYTGCIANHFPAQNALDLQDFAYTISNYFRGW